MGYKQSGNVAIRHHSGFLSQKEKEENFWNNTKKEKDKKTGEKVEKAIYPEKNLQIHLFDSIKLCQINALGDRKTLKALEINKDDRKRGKAPLSDTMGRKNKGKTAQKDNK